LYFDKVNQSLDLDLEYGGAKVGEVARDFEEISIEGKYADFKVYVEPGSYFKIDAFAEYAAIRYPDNLNIEYEVEKGVSHEVRGYVGQKSAPSTIKARLRYGGLKLK